MACNQGDNTLETMYVNFSIIQNKIMLIKQVASGNDNTCI